MDLRQLSYVVAVVDQGGFTKAADAMCVAQPSLSQAVKMLEAELGVALFDRVGRRVVLTAAGEALLGPARQALRDAQNVRSSVDAVRGLVGGHLDIVCLPTLAMSPVADYVAEFRRRHPKVIVRIREPDDAPHLVDMIESGESELGFTELPVPANGLIAIELAVQEFVAVLPGPPTGEASIPIAKLAGLPLITTSPGTSTRRLVDEALGRAGILPLVAVETDHREMMSVLVRDGVGYAILPRPVAAQLASTAVHVVAIRPRIHRRVGVIRRDAPPSPAGQAFLDVVSRGADAVDASTARVSRVRRAGGRP